MAEDGGLAVADETPADDLADDGFAADLIGDFTSDTQEAASQTDEQHPQTDATNDSSQEFDPSSVDLLRTNLDDVPETHKPLVERYQKLAKDLRANTQRVETDLQNQLQKLQENQQQAFKPEVLTNAVREGMKPSDDDKFANLTPEQRAAVDTVKELIGGEIAPINDKLSQFEEMQQMVQQMVQERQMQQQAALQQQVTEARDAYGDQLDQYGLQIKALIATPNPRTGQNFTVKEAYEAVSGVQVQQSQQLAQKEQQVIADAKRQVSTPPNGGIMSNGGNDGQQMSDDDLVAEMQKLGFA